METAINLLKARQLFLDREIADIVRGRDELRERAAQCQDTIDGYAKELGQLNAAISMINNYIESRR